jgi:hypothetical protein
MASQLHSHLYGASSRTKPAAAWHRCTDLPDSTAGDACFDTIKETHQSGNAVTIHEGTDARSENRFCPSKLLVHAVVLQVSGARLLKVVKGIAGSQSEAVCSQGRDSENYTDAKKESKRLHCTADHTIYVARISAA